MIPPLHLFTWPMPIGKYKASFLPQVPFGYLKELIKNKTINEAHPQIKQYVDYVESNCMLGSASPSKNCTKITYATESIAKAELSRIKSREQKHKKPYRAYECPDCGGWHLTSKEDINWLKKQSCEK